MSGCGDTFEGFEVTQGSDWVQDLLLEAPEGTIRPLTGYSARMQVRKTVQSSQVEIELTVANGRIVIDAPAGKVTLKLTAAETASLVAENRTQRWVCDVELVGPTGSVERIPDVAAPFIVHPNVTR